MSEMEGDTVVMEIRSSLDFAVLLILLPFVCARRERESWERNEGIRVVVVLGLHRQRDEVEFGIDWYKVDVWMQQIFCACLHGTAEK